MSQSVLIIEISRYFVSNCINDGIPYGERNLYEYTRLWRLEAENAEALLISDRCFLDAMDCLLMWQAHCNHLFEAQAWPDREVRALISASDIDSLNDADQVICIEALAIASQCEEVIRQYWEQQSQSHGGSALPCFSETPPTLSQVVSSSYP